MIYPTILTDWGKQFKQRAKQAIGVLAIISVFTSMTPVSAVNLQTKRIVLSSFPLQVANLDEEAAPEEEPAPFPVVENKAPLKTITVTATAYNSLVGQTDSTPCIPAMPKFDLCKFYEENGFGNSIAANFLPLGTQVTFPDLYGDKIFVVRDRMNARYGYGRVDIWMHEKADAKAFGVKRGLKMEIYGKEGNKGQLVVASK